MFKLDGFDLEAPAVNEVNMIKVAATLMCLVSNEVPGVYLNGTQI